MAEKSDIQLRKEFDKETFKEMVKENVKTLYRRTIDEATQQQLFQAVSYAVKEAIIDDWLATQEAYKKSDAKTVYYMSMEFLMGRALGNNLINLTVYDGVKEALEELGLDLNVIEDQEPDAALGNGGLGRLAACFLDSLATLNYPAYGCGIRYRYGMFKQKIKDGYQVETPDNWLKDGNPFELRRDEYTKEVRFGGKVRFERDPETGRDKFIQEDFESVLAIPYDMPIVGYGNHVVNTLRIWDAKAITDFQLDSFDRGDYHKAVEQENLAKTCAYTNHTIMAEALEKWPIDLFSRLLPRIYQIVQEIDRRFVNEVRAKYPGNEEKVRKMAILWDGQVRMANMAIIAGFSVNGVAALHTEILKHEQLKDFYEIMPEKFNNKTNGITQRRFLAHGNPLLANWVTEKIGNGWITDLSQLSKLKPLADDPKSRDEFMQIKYQNKVRLAKYIKEHNGIDVDPRSIFDVQVKRLHEYKRQFLNILHVMYLYNQIKEHPELSFYPRTFIFGAKAAAGYLRAKETIKLINSVADVVNNDRSINGKLKVVFIEDYRVSNAELIFAAADVSEQISTASKEASGTGNMKFMLNGAPTLGTMDGANVEIVEEVGAENAFIFGMSSEEVINYENNGGYNPTDIYFNDWELKRVIDQLMDGTYANGDHNMYKNLYNSLLNTQCTDRPDMYFILKDFRSYADAQRRVEEAYRDKDRWARMALLNTASCGKFSSDRTIEEYVRDIWKLEKVEVASKQPE